METYTYLDFFNGEIRHAKCEVISKTRKTALIRLTEFGPKGRPPGSEMRVRLSSLGIVPDPPEGFDPDWRTYTDI